MNNEDYTIIGKNFPRKDSLLKVTGSAKFAADLKVHGMLKTKLLRSPYAHAKIINIDTGKAESLPGVKAVVTYKDAAGMPPLHGLIPLVPGKETAYTWYVLNKELFYHGDIVAAVAAESEAAADEALGLIEIKYEVLPHILDPEESLKPGAFLVHPEVGSNIVPPFYPRECTLGEVEEGFKEADYIVEETYRAPDQHPAYLEPVTVISQWDADELIVWASTQGPYHVRVNIAKVLGLPLNKVRVIVPYVGGGFGGKILSESKPAVIAALLAKKANRPVKIEYSWEECCIDLHNHLGPIVYKGKIGVKKDGTITAMDSEGITAKGAHAHFGAIGNAYMGSDSGMSAYRAKNKRYRGYPVYTNTTLGGPLRGYGASHGFFAIEGLIDDAAEKIGMDPVEFRIRNASRAGDRITQYLLWGLLASGDLPELLRVGREKFAWQKRWKGWGKPTEIIGSKRKGVGVALSMHCSGVGADSAIVKIDEDGTATVLIAASEIGQGIETAMCKIAAEVLGIRYEDVKKETVDTSTSPFSLVAASRGMTVACASVYNAALDARKQLFIIAAEQLEANVEDLEAKDRRIYVKGSPEREISITDIAGLYGGMMPISGRGYASTGSVAKPDPATGLSLYEKGLNVSFSEVEVDTETGGVKILKIVFVTDCGIAINPETLRGQCIGGIIIGSGMALTEGIIRDDKGKVLNSTLSDYRIQGSLDLPPDVEAVIVENPAYASTVPMKAKGCAESVNVSVVPSIANAIYNAIGVRVRELPMTRERILKALKGKRIKNMIKEKKNVFTQI